MTQTRPEIALGGARVSTEGLHWGHYLGCVLALDRVGADQAYFIIRDVDRDNGGIVGANHDATIAFAKDILAAQLSTPLALVRQSFLLAEAPRFWRYLLSTVSLRHLINAHPIRREFLARRIPDIALANLLFPLDSLHTYYCIGASSICMNDDNIRFVGLGARYARKLASGWKDLIPVPKLVNGPAPRLTGHDHRKVSHGNGNAFYLRNGSERVEEYVFRLFNKSSFFRKFPEEHAKYCAAPKIYQFPYAFAPFSHLCLFYGEQRALELWSSASIDKFPLLRQILVESARSCLSRFGEANSRLTDGQVEASLLSSELALKPRLSTLESRVQSLA